jgi:hypothetical protein
MMDERDDRREEAVGYCSPAMCASAAWTEKRGRNAGAQRLRARHRRHRGET